MTEYTVPEGYRLQPEEEYYDTQVMLDDLRTLVLRLARALDKPSGNTLLARQATDYLERKGLGGSAQRTAGQNGGIRSLFNACMFKGECCQRADELAEAQKDTHRMAWIEHYGRIDPFSIRPIFDGTTHWVLEVFAANPLVEAPTLAEMIDKAMAIWPMREKRHG